LSPEEEARRQLYYGIVAAAAGVIIVGGIVKMVRDTIAAQKAAALRPRKPWDLY
jgi:hypothetical protein